MIFDTHAHYDDEAFDEDREEVLASLPAAGVGALVNIGASLRSSRTSRQLAESHEHIYFAAGVHPEDIGELEELGDAAAEAALRQVLQGEKLAAVGEIGLDYHYEEMLPPEIQKKWFIRQLELARELGLPAVVHSRDAAADTLETVKSEARGLTLDIHCFSYGKELAREYLDLGHYLGVGGVVTYKNGRKLKEVVEYMPLDRLLLETDCPYLSPEPFRGRRNSSARLPLAVAEIARLKGTDPETVEAVTWENACRFYHLPLTGTEV